MLQGEEEHISANNPFAEAILSFIDELRDNDDRKSIFYKEVVQVACSLYMAEDDMDQSLLSAVGLSNYISDLQIEHRKKSGIRKTFSFVQPLVEGLMQYTSAVDAMVQADPTVSALIYGGAKLVLQLANDYTKYFEQITLMMEEIGVQLRCFHIYTREFAADKYLNGILCNSYRDILLFWRDASKILNQRGKRFFAGGLLVPFKERYGKFKSKLDKNAQSIERMTQALHIEAQGTFNRSQSLQFQDLTRAIERGPSPRPPDYSDSGTVTQHDEIRKWVSGGRFSRIDPKPDLERHLSSRHVGTAEWIFQDSTYTKWLSLGETSSMWINAQPGSGKSVLAASIIDNLQQSQKKSQKNIIYFFCCFDEPEKCKAISALRSLAIQALKLLKYIPDELYELYKYECSAEDCYVANLTIAEKVLGYLLKRIDYVSVVIDGLDECREPVILDSLIRLREQKLHGITKWLFTSRNDAIVRKKFENSKCDILTIPKKIIQGDIRKFLEDNSDLLCGTCDQLDRITDMSEGNFLMMRLTVDPFRSDELTCSEEFEEALETFQPELGRCWFRSLQRLLQRSAQVQELAQLVFMAVILAVQPMTFNELIDFLSVRIGEEPSSRRQRTRSVILSACAPFIEVDYDKDFVNPTLRLVHKSLGDFLFQDPTTIEFVTQDCYKFFVDYETGHTEIGQRCMSYLSYNRYEDFVDLSLADTAEHGLLKYASIFWYKHVDNGGKGKPVFDMVRDLLESPNFWTCVRVQAKYAPHTFAKLAYQVNTDDYLIASSKNDSKKASYPDQVYYADALPSWLHIYDNEGDDIVWSYHMFVREWGESCLRYPNHIQHYFARILGNRGFWWMKDDQNPEIQVAVLEDSTAPFDAPKFLGIENSEEQCLPAWQTYSRLESDSKISENAVVPVYVEDTIAKIPGDWELYSQAAVQSGHATANVYRYISTTCNCESEEEDSDDETETKDEEDASKDALHKASIWFLSIDTSKQPLRWFHYVTKTGTLQKSAPVFASGTHFLLWPQDGTNVLVVDTNTWQSQISKLPIEKDNWDFVLISQDHYYSSFTSQLHRASVYISGTDLCTITHSIFKFPFPSLSHAQNAVQTTPTLLSSQDITWARPTPSIDLPLSFTWHNATLYLSLSTAGLKLIRFPPSALPQIHKARLQLPSSTYSRQARFHISSSSTNTNSKMQAIYILGPLVKEELRAVALRFKLEGGEEMWEEYDFDKLLKEDGSKNLGTRFWKGAYAAKEQAFSVPIRSGLDWRRSAYVTCW